MKPLDKLSTMTNIAYVLVDVLETNLMDMEHEYRRQGYELRHDAKRNFNTAIAAIRRLKSYVGKCRSSVQEDFGNDADIVNALLLTIIDRTGDDDMQSFRLYNYIKAMPSRLHLELDIDEKSVFGHVLKEIE